MSLFLCIVLLVGTTFAWFTDSVTNSGNKIQAGNLDIDFVQLGKTLTDDQKSKIKEAIKGDIKEDTYYSISEIEKPVFNYAKWEPGYTEVKALGVINKGTLALKFRLDIESYGEIGKLAEVIDVYAKISDKPITDIPTTFDGLLENEYKNLGPLSSLVGDPDGVAYGELHAKQGAYATIAFHMKEDAGNNYQKAKLNSFDIKLNSTQLAHEEDGFGNNQYDSGAEYPVIVDSQLSDAIENAQSGDTVLLAPGTYKSIQSCTLKDGVILAGAGADKTLLNVGNNGYDITSDNVTVKDLKIKGKLFGTTPDGVYAVKLAGNNSRIENSTIQGGGKGTNCASVIVNLSEGETALIKNTNIYGAYRGIYLQNQKGSVVVDGCEITGTTYLISVNGGGDFTVTVKNSKLVGWISFAPIKHTLFENTELESGMGNAFIRPYSDTTFRGCTFESEFKIGAGGDNMKTYVFENCYKDGTKVTADNIRTLLFDESDSGFASKTVTAIVDGVNVNMN